MAICTYNESKNIDVMLSRLRQALPEADLLVVDDDSPDGTSQQVREFCRRDNKVELIVRENERGLGGAIRAAIEYAVQNRYRYFLNLDGDLSHDPDQLPSLLQAMTQDPELDVVIGSRYISGGRIEGWPLKRRIMSRMINRFATTVLRLPVRDCSGSMRCYRVGALEKLDPASLRIQGYALLEELLVRMNRDGAKMAEVPITFSERQQGESKLTFGEAIRSVTAMLSLAVSR
ncbi:MAG: polyprenol monophosphomannose synthase [Planctomycetota bacterium]